MFTALSCSNARLNCSCAHYIDHTLEQLATTQCLKALCILTSARCLTDYFGKESLNLPASERTVEPGGIEPSGLLTTTSEINSALPVMDTSS